MEFFRRAHGTPNLLAILAGTFNPPTRAHLALAEAALARADEVLFVLPRVFPHKDFHGVEFEDRMQLLLAATAAEPRYSVAAASRGLFAEIARECRAVYPEGARLAFLCGADAAQRIVEWDYGEPGAIMRMLNDFEVWVADRQTCYLPPKNLQNRVLPLPISEDFQAISATQVRERIARGEAWEHFVPDSTREMVRRLYS